MNEEVKKSTVDKGWKAMREMLDREMPENKPKRRFLWWMFAFLFIPLTIWGGLTWFTGFEPKKDDGKKHERPVPMAWNSKGPDNPLSQTASHSPEQPIATRASSSEKPVGITTEASNAALQQQRTYLPPNSPQAIQPGTNPVEDSGAILQWNPAPAAKESITEVYEKQGIDPIFSIPVIPDPMKIPVNHPDLVGVQINQTIPPAVEEAVKNKRQTWQWGASIQGVTNNFKGINGYGAGLAINWQPFERWGLRSGINAMKYVSSNAGSQAVSVQSADYEKATDTLFVIEDLNGNQFFPGTNYGNPLDESVIIPVTKYSTVEIPLLVTWQAWRFLQIQAGVYGGYVYNSKAGGTSYSGELSLSPTSEEAAKNVDALAQQNIEKWRMDFAGGLEYKMNRHLRIGASVKTPIQFGTKSSKAQYQPATSNMDDPGVRFSLRKSPSFALALSYFF